MKNMLLTMTVLSLLVSLSGCLYPVGGWRGDWRQDRYGQGNGNRPNTVRDCWMRDGHRYCRDGN